MFRLSRRSTLFGLTTWFSGLGSRLALARAPTEKRLVVINLRGGLDGLAAVAPYGDPDFATLRPQGPAQPGQPEGLLDLGGFFGLNPALGTLHKFYTTGEAVILHAVAGSHRERSHFMAQDIVESGAERRMTSGWLSRAVAAGKGGVRDPLAVGGGVPLLLRGPAPADSWAPAAAVTPFPDLVNAIAALHEPDRLTGPAIKAGLAARGFSATVMTDGDTPARVDFAALATAAGKLLAAPNGPRVAALDLGGWDTHAAQAARIALPLRQLDDGLAALHTALGPAWRQTAILVMTEFGRTARMNGTTGTDHGTATVAFVLGGAVAGGKVIADWPGLAPGKLYEDRDLAPTRDLRSVAKALTRAQLAVPDAAMAGVFPDSAAVEALGGLVKAG
jgi:uncharacterized protein (DUF1501 family)